MSLNAERKAKLRGPGKSEPVLESIEGLGDRVYLRLRGVLGWTVVNLVMLAVAIVCVLAHLITGFRARRFCLDVIAPAGARLIMRLLRIDVHMHGFEDLPSPCIVTGNHSSTLDLFVISMLPIAHKRSFMSRWTKLYPPLAILGWSTGTFFTPPQSLPAERVRCFARAEAILRETRDSVFLTPEGTRWTTGGVGPFNKGTFHLATELGWPIVPVYIDVPRRINPGTGFRTRPGEIHVYAHSPIDTHDWELPDLLRHRDELRALYLAYPEGWRA
ncbi:lysophospholipid acyltransferase family protein [Nannocystaceae bacterium ST9]